MIWSEICEHGEMTIQRGKKTRLCQMCNRKRKPNRAFHVDAKTYFNRTLQRECSSLHETEKIARRRGLELIGNTPFKDVANSRWADHPMTERIPDGI